MRCTQNDVENDYDGGVVLLQQIQGQPTDDVIDGRVAMSCRHDSFMYNYPVTREDKQQRFFKVTIEEIPEGEVPPDPRAPKAPSAFDLLIQARDAALSAGNTALADQLTASINSGVAVAPSA